METIFVDFQAAAEGKGAAAVYRAAQLAADRLKSLESERKHPNLPAIPHEFYKDGAYVSQVSVIILVLPICSADTYISRYRALNRFATDAVFICLSEWRGYDDWLGLESEVLTVPTEWNSITEDDS